MARPRIFVSSTYYDLKHIRSSLELFIGSLGYEAILSEKGSIAYTFDQALDESCYRDAGSADILVMIVGGRYGAERSGRPKKSDKKFYDRYDSITRREFETAYDNGVPVYILVESAVHAEYQTYLKNRANTSVAYAHVDSVNVFSMLEEILNRPKNNPVYTFDHSSDIEAWLKDQWAGLFREMLRKSSQQKQMSALAAQIEDLRVVNDTLKTYLEAVLKNSAAGDSEKLIETEDRKIDESRKLHSLRESIVFEYLTNMGMSTEDAIEAFEESRSFDEFVEKVQRSEIAEGEKPSFEEFLRGDIGKDVNWARARLGLGELTWEEEG